MAKKDPIYIELTSQFPTKVGFNLLIHTNDIKGKFEFENVGLKDLKKLVNKYYNNESATIISYPNPGSNNINYKLNYTNDPRLGNYPFYIDTNPRGIEIRLSPDIAELLIEKFSRLLEDQKGKI
jgi:hypothetical protein